MVSLASQDNLGSQIVRSVVLHCRHSYASPLTRLVTLSCPNNRLDRYAEKVAINKQRFAEDSHHAGVVLITAAAVIAIVGKIPRLPVREYSGPNLSLPAREEHPQSNANLGVRSFN